MQIKFKKAFTLIELLIVIAIIGILASIIIVATNSARDKAKSAKVETALGQLKVAAEVNYSKTKDYREFFKPLDPWQGVITSTGDPNCSEISSVTDNELKNICQIVRSTGSSLKVMVSKDAYAADANLLPRTKQINECVDSQGSKSIGVPPDPSTSITSIICPVR